MDLTRERIAAVDRGGMLERILTLGMQLRDAWEVAQQVSPAVDRTRVRNIVVAGMGGSAISADIVRTISSAESSLPLTVSRDYELPRYVGRESLVITSSYSGNTEETLSAFRDARRKGAQIVAITSGGELRQSAQETGISVYPIDISSPPRAAIAHLVAPLLHVLASLQQISDPSLAVQAAANRLEDLAGRLGPDSGGDENQCAVLAAKLHDKLPLIYASTSPLEGVAWRWKGQFSENSKMLAFANTFPELNHNEIVGWGLNKALQERLQVVYLRDQGEHPRIKRRFAITRQILSTQTDPVIEVWSEGESLLERLFSLVFVGDLTSLYLAVANGVDPTPVINIDILKERLAQD